VTLDLTDRAVWLILLAPLGFDKFADQLFCFCRGSAGRPYDYLGIDGIGTDKSFLHVGFARFCSDECTNVLQQIAGSFKAVKPWMVAPSGFKGQADRFGLYELALAEGWTPLVTVRD